MTIGRRIALGLLLAFFAQFFGLMLAGAGHGWVAPLFISIVLWVLWPMTLAIGWPIGRGSRRTLAAMIVAALVADAWLISKSLGEADYISRYVEINGVVGSLIIGLWLLLWTIWQAILVCSLAAPRKPANDANA
jgi:hypothetical protein